MLQIPIYEDNGSDPYEDAELQTLSEIGSGEVFDLSPPVASLDTIRYVEMLYVMNGLVDLEENQEIEVAPYNRQQVVISEIPTDEVASKDIIDVSFPAVGAEYLTKKNLEGIAWNVGRIRAGKRVSTLAYCCKEVDDHADEAVMFNVVFGKTDQRTFLWNHNKILRVPRDYNLELRYRDGQYYNYTNSANNEIYKSVPCRHTLFERGKSYYVYVDGVPLYMPYTALGVVKVEGGEARANEGTVIFKCDWEPGNYLVDLISHSIVKRVTRRPDSRQQLQILRESVVTTDFLLDKFPYLLGKGKKITNFGVEIVDEIDTTNDDCQLVKIDTKEMDNRKKIFQFLAEKNDFCTAMTCLSNFGVIVGNFRYSHFHGHFSYDVGRYLDKYYIRTRGPDSVIVIKGMKPYHLNGTWYELSTRPVGKKI